MTDYLTIKLPGRRCPLHAVAVLAWFANAARVLRLHGTSRRLAAWAYDIADHCGDSDAWQAHRDSMPWAWGTRAAVLAWWSMRA